MRFSSLRFVMWATVLRQMTPRVVIRLNSITSNIGTKTFASFTKKGTLSGEVASEVQTSSDDELQPGSKDTSLFAADIPAKYKAFVDEESIEIYDVEEERRKYRAIKEAEVVDEFRNVSLKRGVTGVFDISDLLDILKQQKARDLFVVSVPPEYRYVSMMVVATGSSTTHLQAITEFVRKVYKRRKGRRDPGLKIEGEQSSVWKALDLGNIALHIFLKPTREMYDLESLWSLGAEYDNLSRKPDDPLIALLQSQFGLQGLEPASSNKTIK